jgi:hypothetical protein
MSMGSHLIHLRAQSLPDGVEETNETYIWRLVRATVLPASSGGVFDPVIDELWIPMVGAARAGS